MNNIFFRTFFFIINIYILSGCLYSAEKTSRSPMPLPPRRIPAEKLNNDVYVEIQDKKTPITLRYFTREDGCVPGYYFKTESIVPLANIRNNSYACSIKRKSNGASPITFTYGKSTQTVLANRCDSFIVCAEDKNHRVIITKNGSSVAEFTIK